MHTFYHCLFSCWRCTSAAFMELSYSSKRHNDSGKSRTNIWVSDATCFCFKIIFFCKRMLPRGKQWIFTFFQHSVRFLEKQFRNNLILICQLCFRFWFIVSYLFLRPEPVAQWLRRRKIWFQNTYSAELGTKISGKYDLAKISSQALLLHTL